MKKITIKNSNRVYILVSNSSLDNIYYTYEEKAQTRKPIFYFKCFFSVSYIIIIIINTNETIEIPKLMANPNRYSIQQIIAPILYISITLVSSSIEQTVSTRAPHANEPTYKIRL